MTPKYEITRIAHPKFPWMHRIRALRNVREDVRAGDEAEIFGASLPAEESAGHMGTVQYELLCAVSPRVPRVYLEE